MALGAGCGALQPAASGPLARFRETLAQWSLEDAQMRRTVQKEMRAEELEGDPEAIDAFRKLQKFYSTILDEEEYRAARIVEGRGAVVRPAEAPPDVRGPLGDLEQRLSEARPRDVAAALGGGLRNMAEALATEWARIDASERSRRALSEASGVRQRPLDAPPSLLGDIEGFVDALFVEEQARVRADALTTRPRDVPARYRGPLADLERRVDDYLEVVRGYETKRVAIIRERLQRPMDSDPTSVAGWTEAFLTGLARGPLLVRALVLRITELLDSKVLPNEYDTDFDDDAAFEAALRRGKR